MRRWDVHLPDPAQAGFAFRKPYAQAARRSDRYGLPRQFDYGRGMAAIARSGRRPSARVIGPRHLVGGGGPRSDVLLNLSNCVSAIRTPVGRLVSCSQPRWTANDFSKPTHREGCIDASRADVRVASMRCSQQVIGAHYPNRSATSADHVKRGELELASRRKDAICSYH